MSSDFDPSFPPFLDLTSPPISQRVTRLVIMSSSLLPRRIPATRISCLRSPPTAFLRRTATSTPPPPPSPTSTVYTPGKQAYRPKGNSPPPRPPPEISGKPRSPDSEVMVKTLAPFALLTVMLGLGIGWVKDADAGVHSRIVMPIVRACMDAEGSHRFAINFLRYGWILRPTDINADTENLEVDVSTLASCPSRSTHVS